MAQWVRPLLIKHEVMSSNPKRSCKEPDMERASHVKSQPVYLEPWHCRNLLAISLALGSKRACLKGMNQKRMEQNTQCSPLVSITHMYFL